MSVIDRLAPIEHVPIEPAYTYKQARTVVTATVALFFFDGGQWVTFLGKRNPKSSAFPGKWCMAGGKLEAKSETCVGERVEDAALREVQEETGMILREDQLDFFMISSHPDTDPRGHFVNVVYTAIVDSDQYKATQPGSDLCDGGWFTFSQTISRDYAFDHKVLLEAAQKHMRGWE